jgi:hypothetical protein
VARIITLVARSFFPYETNKTTQCCFAGVPATKNCDVHRSHISLFRIEKKPDYHLIAGTPAKQHFPDKTT